MTDLESQEHGSCLEVPAAQDAVGVGAAAAPAPVTPSQRQLVTVSVMAASIMQSLDNTIANVALPRIQGALSATQDQIAWV
jgi:DHA2 family multidrug resistance protein